MFVMPILALTDNHLLCGTHSPTTQVFVSHRFGTGLEDRRIVAAPCNPLRWQNTSVKMLAQELKKNKFIHGMINLLTSYTSEGSSSSGRGGGKGRFLLSLISVLESSRCGWKENQFINFKIASNILLKSIRVPEVGTVEGGEIKDRLHFWLRVRHVEVEMSWT